ncbi:MULTISPECIES: EnvZ/OmpR regulon moderator MzrA [Tatumella]|uniref:EnvZ/OmpR regulon moderator MzrA n=1 Tax=Tatumella punctata TaxID=399969 RepID=A0ABW1VK54_9GAMM|nr:MULTISPECIES: EnvZ/OmpR regulon moderator MzrA [unclassified Tatumella]MBS0855219.1 EnvZ/OmpR regulon moderator MzrA [Tatumella sp. JGM16]MBS0876771.1 EnvZ/OmpR regulon moderator MzrA [Tatumella sp. JGM82]MBS0889804.1 EnvZ/OmpR regulon moderator MzrA [Tatumella sp. JGM94]MBS0892882.1 EnvZ/OmpR regulon moderator MzrA [Tatumella sp. JGM130]MBS0901526.1 EnvZ/OmpR regulon moderator MzrA [Tatumella sp. JGM100]
MHSRNVFIRYRLAALLAISCILVITGVILTSDFLQETPQVRIGVTYKGTNLPDGFFIYQQLSARGIIIKSITPEQDMLVIRLESEDQRLEAQKLLRQILSDAYTSV